MEKKLKRKCIKSCIGIVLGITTIILSLKLEGLSELQKTYMSGFGEGLIPVCLVLLIKNILALRNSKTLRDREIELTDERNIEIQIKSMAVTFRTCILLQAIGSMILSIFMNNELGLYLGFLVGIQLIIYIISCVIISKRI